MSPTAATDATADIVAKASNAVDQMGSGIETVVLSDRGVAGADTPAAVPLVPMQAPQLPGASDTTSLVANLVTMDGEGGAAEAEEGGDTLSPLQNSLRSPTRAGRVASKRHDALLAAEEQGGKLDGETEKELAEEAAEAANHASEMAKSAMIIANAAAPVQLEGAQLEEALQDDGLVAPQDVGASASVGVGGAAGAGAGAGAEEGAQADAEPEVPLTKTKHTLSFRFVGREMLEGKTFQDPDLDTVSAVAICVARTVHELAGNCCAVTAAPVDGSRLVSPGHPVCAGASVLQE